MTMFRFTAKFAENADKNGKITTDDTEDTEDTRIRRKGRNGGRLKKEARGKRLECRGRRGTERQGRKCPTPFTCHSLSGDKRFFVP